MQNENIEQPATQPEPSQSLKSLKGKLKAAFTWKSLKGFAKTAANKAWSNKEEIVLSGMTGMAFKWGVLACTASVITSTAGVLAVGAGIGATTALIKHGIHLAMAKDEKERNSRRLSNKDMFKKMAWGAGFGIIGSASGLGLISFHNLTDNVCFSKLSTLKDMFITARPADTIVGIVDHVTKPAISLLQTTPPVAETLGRITDHIDTHTAVTMTPIAPDTSDAVKLPTAPPAVSPDPLPTTTPDTVISAAPITAPASPLDAIKDYAAHNKISPRLKDALHRAESPSLRIRAQALDDIGVYAPKELQVQAYELLKQSAGMGNLKAQADIISMEFYGNKTLGIKADPEAAIDKMVELAKRSKVAAKLVKQWVGDPSGPVAPASVPAAMSHHVIPASPVPKMVDVTATPVTSPAHVIPSTPTPKMVDVTNIHMAETAVPAPSLNAPEPDCIVKFDIHRPKTMIMDCADNGAEIGKIGDVINVVRPPILNIVMPPRP